MRDRVGASPRQVARILVIVDYVCGFQEGIRNTTAYFFQCTSFGAQREADRRAKVSCHVTQPSSPTVGLLLLFQIPKQQGSRPF